MAETRETQVLEDVVESTEIENPRTTEEAILAQVIAGDEVTINARTRLQKYLSQLKNESGASGYNSYISVSGKLNNPWGEYSFSDILSIVKKVRSDINCSCLMTTSSGTITLIDNEVTLYGFTGYAESGYSQCIMAFWDSNGIVSYFDVDTDGTVTDRIQEAPITNTTLYIPVEGN